MSRLTPGHGYGGMLDGTIYAPAQAGQQTPVAQSVSPEYLSLFIASPDMLAALKLCKERMGDKFPHEAQVAIDEAEKVHE